MSFCDVPSYRLLEPLCFDTPLVLLDARISCFLDARRLRAIFSALARGSSVRGWSNAALFGGAHQDLFTVITEVSGTASAILSPWELPLQDLNASSFNSSLSVRGLDLDASLDLVLPLTSSATYRILLKEEVIDYLPKEGDVCLLLAFLKSSSASSCLAVSSMGRPSFCLLYYSITVANSRANSLPYSISSS